MRTLALLDPLFVAIGAPATPGEAPPTAPELTPEERALVRPHMTTHAVDVGALYGAYGRGDLASLERAARAVAEAPPIDVEGLPPLFVELDGVLRDHAGTLVRAVGAGDVAEARRSFLWLGRTCDRCHRSWFTPPTR